VWHNPAKQQLFIKAVFPVQDRWLVGFRQEVLSSSSWMMVLLMTGDDKTMHLYQGCQATVVSSNVW
jgi:hypothetical protein